MKRILFTFTLVLLALSVQAEHQYSLYITLDAGKDYHYTANSHITLLSGFKSEPKNGHEVLLEIDSYAIEPPPYGITGGPSPYDNGVVGSLGGTVDVSRLGGAVYSIPLDLPEGTGGLKPQLCITYNSQARNGLLGWGWDLGGISSITRTGGDYYHDGYINVVNHQDDRFCLDGMRLMMIGSGTYGGHQTQYRTEQDQLSVIVSYNTSTNNGPSYFKVSTADGKTLYYGITSDSKALMSGNNVNVWLLSKVEDSYGNTMIYHYHNDSDSYRLESITYASNKIDNITPNFTVEFQYTSRHDAEISYVGNCFHKRKHILKEIVVKNGASVMYSYKFTYQTPQPHEGYSYHLLTKIQLFADDEHLNPTTIQWGNNNYHSTSGADLKLPVTTNDGNGLVNTIKFSGDFNGDGYSDILALKPDGNGTLSTAKVYLNKGVSSSLVFHFIHSFNLNPNVSWVQVADFDGDGLDDILFSNRQRRGPIFPDLIDTEIYLSRLTESGSAAFYRHLAPQFCVPDYMVEAHLVGDFFGEGKCSFLVQAANNNSNGIDFSLFCTYDDTDDKFHTTIFGGRLQSDRFFPADYNGDGITEILYKKSSGSTAIVQLKKVGNTYQYDEIYTGSPSTWSDCFPGDFNGDGLVDALFYTQGSSPWTIRLSKQSGFSSTIYTLPPTFPYDSPGNYQFSLDNLHTTSHYIKVADLDGNGCADLALYHDYKFYVYYGPLRSDCEDAPFSNSQQLSTQSFNLYDNLNVCIGNFLGQESQSYLGSTTLSRLPVMTLRHEVNRITDGFGRKTEFGYNYLMPNPNQPTEDDFYRFQTSTLSRGNPVRCTAIPIRALQKTITYNVKGKPMETRCFYESALFHTQGKGFLGFTTTRQDDYNNNQLQKKTIRQYELASPGSIPHLMLSDEYVFNNNAQLMATSTFFNTLYTHLNNDKVYIPMSDKTLMEFDAQHPNIMLKKEIHKALVNTHCSDPLKYLHVLSVTSQTKGVTTNPNCGNPNNCEFQETIQTTYMPDNLTKWIINRPATTTNIFHRQGDYEDICHTKEFTYDNGSYQIHSVLDLPNDGSDPFDRLATLTTYQYDPTGNIVSTVISTPNDNLESRTELFEYSKDYERRLLTKHTDIAGRETQYSYHAVYNYCTQTIDDNGNTTHYAQDPLGVTRETRHPDGTVTYQALRWSSGNYESWEKRTGQQTTKTRYAPTGDEIRRFTIDLNGESVFTDIEYDDMGRIVKKTKPFRVGGNPRFTRYEYNNYNQIHRITHADGTFETIEHDGNTKTASFTSNDRSTQTQSKTFNIMGWVVKSTDTEGNSVIYDYYPDGKPKWMQIQGHDETRIEMTYDALGNRTSLNDPNYGLTTYEYNAFNQMTKQVTPKQDETCLFYDAAGNLVKRIEKDKQTNQTETTEWLYGQEKGQRGLLIKIKAPNQTIDYSYDNLCRLKKTTEHRGEEEYQTTYTFDKASRVSKITYPTGYAINYCYTSEGNVRNLVGPNSLLLWKASESNTMMQPTKTITGNGYVTHYEYDPNTHRLLSIHTSREGQVIQDYEYQYDDFSNMTSRNDNGKRLSETFTYDPLNRLTSSCDEHGTSSFSYDPLGRMTSKTSPDGIIFSNADYHGSKPHAVKSVQSPPGVFPQERMDLTFTPFDKVKTIQEGTDLISFEYGYDHQRINTTENIHGQTRIKTYVNNCEFISEAGHNPIKRTYLSCPSGVFAVVESVNGNNTLHYIHKDHLGSWTTITDEKGDVEQENHFDAWGNSTNADALMFDRGYTGHEHIRGMDLINMNGRLYDPLTSSMLSPDNDIQLPDVPQNFNRYSYCINNPLSYTDPDGNSFMETALVFYLVYCTDYGYELQKFLSPIAFHIDLHLSSQQLGVGFDASFGVPKDIPFSFRVHGGATFYWRYYDNCFSGMEFRAGLELYTFGLLGYAGTSFYNGKDKQTTNSIILGNANWGVTYENDYMFHIGDYILGGFAADNGDRYRSAAAKIRIGPLFHVGVNLFTGDPGVDHSVRRTYFDPDVESRYYDQEKGGRETYTIGKNGENPDEFRAGVFYVGFGPVRLGGNSEEIRDVFQNHFAHDFLCKGDSPYFKVLDRAPQVYFYFGTGTGNTLW